MAGTIKIGSFEMNWGAKKSAANPYDLSGAYPLSQIMGYADNFSGENVSVTRGLGLSTVWSCINVRSRTIASLPINVYREEGNDKTILEDHPAFYPLAHQPNEYMSSANMFLTSMVHSDGWGNSIIGINRNGRGEVKSFDIICHDEWDVTVVDGKAWYMINGEMYPSRDVLHFRWFAYDGLRGVSPIQQNQMLMGSALKQNRYSGMALGEKPPGFLKYEGQLTAPQRAQNQESWQKDRVGGKVPILTGNWDYKSVMINPSDSEYIALAGLTEQQICAIYQMPPVFLQNYQRATWSNAEQADLVYAKHTIAPIIRVIEQECNMKLFTEKEKKNTFVKFNMNGLLRGDLQARAAFYTAMRNIGGMNGNEIRSNEDQNSYEGGDIYTVQGALVPVDQLREFYATKLAPEQPAAAPTESKKVNGVKHEYN